MWGFDDLYEVLGDFLYNVVYMVLYPFISLFTILLNSVIFLFNSLLGLYNAITGLADSIISFITSFLSIFMVDTWTTLIIIGFGIVVVLRVYYFLKDISIAGFKI